MESHLQPFSPEEQRVAVALYWELAKGKPVDPKQLGRALGASSAESRALLQRPAIRRFVYPDDKGRIVYRFAMLRMSADAAPAITSSASARCWTMMAKAASRSPSVWAVSTCRHSP